MVKIPGCKSKAIWSKLTATFSKDFLKGKKNGFAKVGIEVADEFYDKFNEMRLLFVAQIIPDCNILEAIKMYKKNNRKTIKRNQKATWCYESD